MMSSTLVPLGGGQILPTADVFKPPEVPPELIERDNFIPYDFALSKLKAAANDYNALKTSYEEFVFQLKTAHDLQSEHVKTFYENYIQELRSKAKQHVESQKKLRQAVESKLKGEIETLRDNFDSSRDSFTAEIRSLKGQLGISVEGERERLSELDKERTRHECQAVLFDMVGQVEWDILSRIREDEALRVRNEKAALEKQAMTIAQQASAQLNEKDEEGHIRYECRGVLDHVLQQIESDCWDDQRKILRKAANNLRNARELMESQSSNSEAVTAQLARHNKILQQQMSEQETAHTLAMQQHSEEFSAAVSEIQMQLENEKIRGECMSILTEAVTRTELIAQSSAVSLSSPLPSGQLSVPLTTEGVLGSVAAPDASQNELFQRNMDLLLELAQVQQERDSLQAALLAAGNVNDITAAVGTIVGQESITAAISSSAVANNDVSGDGVVALSAAVDGEQPVAAPLVASETLENSETLVLDATQTQAQRLRIVELEGLVTSLTGQIEALQQQHGVSVVEPPTSLAAPAATQQDNDEGAGTGATPIDNGPPPPTADEQTRIDLAERILQLQAQLSETENRLGTCTALCEYLEETKTNAKDFIKEWTREFEEAHEGRTPEQQEKEEIKDKFLEYKTASKELKQANEQMTQVTQEKENVERELAEAEALLVSLGGPVVVPGAVDGNGEGEQVVQGSREEDLRAIEALEDTVYQLQEDLGAVSRARDQLAEDLAFKEKQYDEIVKEKRTDVVKRFEEDLIVLKASEARLTEELASFKAEKMRTDAKLLELKDRTDRAEQELKQKDELELKKLAPGGVQAELTKQIGKQRIEIVNKEKTATLGWDEASKATEELEKEVDKAYRRGKDESLAQRALDMKALNEQLEVKDTRNTELMVQIQLAEQLVKDAEKRVAMAEEDAKLARQEATEIAATFGAGSGGGGDASLADLERARDDLDAAQEEVVVWTEKCDALKESLRVAHDKIEVYEQLVVAANKNAQMRIEQIQAQASAALAGSGGLGELLMTIKQTLDKGTKMWKNNQRNEVFDLYLHVCDDAMQALKTPGLLTHLSECTAQGRMQGQAKKERGAIVLKKGLDRLLIDLANPEHKRAEDEASQAILNEEMQSGEDNATDALTAQLNILSKQEEALQRGLERTEAGGNNDDKTGEGNGEAGDGGVVPAGSHENNDSASSSLLRRAKEAEKMVALLKKQIGQMAMQNQMDSNNNAVVVSADPNQSGVVGSQQDGGGGQVAGAGAVVATTRPAVGGRPGVAAAGAAAAGGANPAEIRKLNKRIKELEETLASNANAGAKDDKKALIALEKTLTRKIKDIESAARKDKTTLESKLAKAEAGLAAATANLPAITGERDRLRVEVKKYASQDAELDKLRKIGTQFEALSTQFQALTKEKDVLAEQYKKETNLRKKYKNELEDLKGAIRVYARCRPMVSYEKERGCKQVVEFLDETRLKVKHTRGERDYEFDTVFDDFSTQDLVFEDTKRLVESCMDGYNVCLFAYGQTGSGKTWTMTGDAKDPQGKNAGLTPKAITEMFRLIDERVHCNIRVTTYFIELYNDNLVDLYWSLDNKKIRDKQGNMPEPPRLDIKMDANKMVHIRNAVVKDVSSFDDLMDLFNQGNAERHTGATRMNAESSRSHSIFSIMIESYDTATKKTVVGKLSLVDLAGSERADKTGATGERAKEGQAINKSLSALGDVMNALSEGEKFIPYRNNKLTQLMQDSLGGNAKTLMFVNFSPADYNADETVSSLNFALRVKKVKNSASKQTGDSAEVTRLKKIIEKLKGGMSGEDGNMLEDDEEEEGAGGGEGGKGGGEEKVSRK